ncbi:MAG: DUF4389 domain-containing protein, partial [Terracoccus sp.]
MSHASIAPPGRRPPDPHPARRHLAALIVGCLLILPGLGLLLAGAGLGTSYAVGRDNEGYVSLTLPALASDSPAITAGDVIVQTGSEVPSWVLSRLDVDMRLSARSLTTDQPVFIGIAPVDGVNAYLSGVPHDQVVGVDGIRNSTTATAVLESVPGTATVTAPTSQTFWTTSATGPGQQQLIWRMTDGQWAAVIMNADGSSGVAVSSTVGVRGGFIMPLALTLFIVGLAVTGGAIALIIRGSSGGGRPTGGRPTSTDPTQTGAPSSIPAAALAQQQQPAYSGHPRAISPVSLDARLDQPLSRWLWLVKWFLAIPHYFALGLLWIAFSVVSIVAFFAILFTGRYPRGLFDLNLGVLRWSWRVSYYCSNGGLGTDRYPPFSLGAEPDYPARLDITYPERLSRGLVLVKWWLLALPHYLIVGLLVGGGTWAWNRGG